MPISRPNDCAFPDTTGSVNAPEYGLTKREYFAIRLLAAASSDLPLHNDAHLQRQRAIRAVRQTDMLLDVLGEYPVQTPPEPDEESEIDAFDSMEPDHRSGAALRPAL